MTREELNKKIEEVSKLKAFEGVSNIVALCIDVRRRLGDSQQDLKNYLTEVGERLCDFLPELSKSV